MANSASHPAFPLTQLPHELGGKVDAFICSASFETRCLSIPRALGPETVGAAYVLRNTDVLGKGIDHAKQIVEEFKGKATEVVISKRNPVVTADEIVRVISDLGIGDRGNLLVDISTFTHETLLILFRIISEKLSNRIVVRYAYTGVKKYNPEDSNEPPWLSRGVSEVYSVLGYPGEMRPSRKSHLIVLVGFEDERALKLIEMYEPNILSLGIGSVDPVRKVHLKTNKDYYRKLMATRTSAKEFEFSPTDAFAVRDVVLEQAKMYGNNNVVVAPMNTKISTLGAALAAIENPDIQICYGRVVSYNIKNYSEPADDCRVFSLSKTNIV